MVSQVFTEDFHPMDNQSGDQYDQSVRRDEEVLQTSTRQYTSELMSHSLVTGVPNIVAAKGKAEKAFRTTVLLLCACGFFYQATSFLIYFLTYPHVVDIEVYVPRVYLQPAYTFCNSNPIKRSKFCEKYPDSCYTPDNMEEFCRQYSDFCRAVGNTTDLRIPSPDVYSYAETNITAVELKELGHTLDALLIDSSVPKEKIQGPYFIFSYRNDKLRMCYSAYLLEESNREATLLDRPGKLFSTIGRFVFNMEPGEVFRPDRKPGVLFVIHSPFEFENPEETGTFVRAGRRYTVRLSLEEENLLPNPYKSDCLNYSEIWEANGRRGPRSQKMNIKKCILDSFVKYCDCFPPVLIYPTQSNVCDISVISENFPCLNASFFEEVPGCEEKYRDECHKVKYSYDFDTRDLEVKWGTGAYTQRSKIEILLTDEEVTKYSYRPQYQPIEVFSYLGGFMGAWIGVSAVAILDLLEAIYSVIGHWFKRRMLTKGRRNL